ncbi:hypothetical protein [Duganella phyllosphaerae]|uniref:Uncharacterized protein n=1 Tax=Duganella phyllosphaerae TaxID=762836 RepID=A0A1E7W4R7_9BURK|nr:hypothetical protein [Duganella phyllosphaerae]OEZ90741.1 hypothetical protein DUPY_53480 [Duganella phyllosphaerae]
MGDILDDFRRSLQRNLQHYSLFTLKSTGEYHLFKAHKNFNSECMAERESECGQVLLADTEIASFACEEEESARLKMARIGRKVCGNCVATLYAS